MTPAFLSVLPVVQIRAHLGGPNRLHILPEARNAPELFVPKAFSLPGHIVSPSLTTDVQSSTMVAVHMTRTVFTIFSCPVAL